MKIEVEKLTQEAAPFVHTYPAGSLDLEDEDARLKAEARVSGQASREGEEVRLRGAISSAMEVVCDRCLAQVSFPVDAEFDVTYVPARILSEGDAKELAAEDLNLSFYTGEMLDLDDLVREQVLLTLPTRLLCREDCKGLCPTCGANSNTQPCDCHRPEVDPRWAALAALKDSDQ